MKVLYFLTLYLYSPIIIAQTTYAVIVGVSDYKMLDYRTGDLAYADSDAARFSMFLQSASGGSVPDRNIVRLLNSRATKHNILRAMEIFKNAGPADRIIYFFSGHGMENTFVPYDFTNTDPESLLTHAEVKRYFKASHANTKLIIADACKSGSMKRGQNSVSAAQVVQEYANMNVAMILSSRSQQASVESSDTKGGIFTFYLLRGLQGKADKNLDKKVTIKELFTYVSPRVKKNAPNGQAPVFSGKFSDDLVLSVIQ